MRPASASSSSGHIHLVCHGSLAIAKHFWKTSMTSDVLCLSRRNPTVNISCKMFSWRIIIAPSAKEGTYQQHHVLDVELFQKKEMFDEIKVAATIRGADALRLFFPRKLSHIHAASLLLSSIMSAASDTPLVMALARFGPVTTPSSQCKGWCYKARQ